MSGQLGSASRLPIGNSIGPYQIKKVLGSGGMGTVYLATQLSLGRDVALKVLRPKRLAAPGAAEKFLDEARCTARLNHPNLVSVHDAGHDDEKNMVYYTMEYVKGLNLRELAQRQGLPPPAHALRICYETALGLGHAHNAGLVHRDLKPDNIMLDTTGRAKVTDLGLAYDRMSGQQYNSSKTLALVGTQEYCAPEQSRNPSKAIAASDIWSLGACLFFALTGKDPFDGETVIDLIVRAATEDPPDLDQLEPAHQELIKQLMCKHPDDRPANGDAAAELIKGVMDGTARIAGKKKSGPLRRVRRRRR